MSLLRECKRPGFAEVALYHKPIGKGITGPSIRFVEAALRCMTNILVETSVTLDDEEKRKIKITVTDLESNLSYPKEIVLDKVVERRKADGRTVISSRTNSSGQTVYLVNATNDEIANKENAEASKAIRVSGLRLLPGDIKDEAIDEIQKTLKSKAKEDPDAARKRLVDAFASVGVHPKHLVAYLRHGVDQINPDELAHLRCVYSSIKDGETTWSEIVEDVEESKEKETKSSRTKEALKERLVSKKNGDGDKIQEELQPMQV